MNRLRKQSKAATPNTDAGTVRLQLTIRISEERWEEFERLARNLGLGRDQLASAMIDSNMEGDELNGFEEIGYHLMDAATELYPEHEPLLGPLRDAFITAFDARRALSKARKQAGAI